nr:MAG TPA: hypothetical protein [Caudoviricetes sp.]
MNVERLGAPLQDVSTGPAPDTPGTKKSPAPATAVKEEE